MMKSLFLSIGSQKIKQKVDPTFLEIYHLLSFIGGIPLLEVKYCCVFAYTHNLLSDPDSEYTTPHPVHAVIVALTYCYYYLLYYQA